MTNTTEEIIARVGNVAGEMAGELSTPGKLDLAKPWKAVIDADLAELRARFAMLAALKDVRGSIAAFRATESGEVTAALHGIDLDRCDSSGYFGARTGNCTPADPCRIHLIVQRLHPFGVPLPRWWTAASEETEQGQVCECAARKALQRMMDEHGHDCERDSLRAELANLTARQGVQQAQWAAREEGLQFELAASRERERWLREALYRGTDHSMSGEWFCASCSFDLKKWAQSGAAGTLPELCPLCKHAAAALATPEGTRSDPRAPTGQATTEGGK